MKGGDKMKNIETKYKTLMTMNIILVILVLALGVYVLNSNGVFDKDVGLSPGSLSSTLISGTQNESVTGYIKNTQTGGEARAALCLTGGDASSCLAKRSSTGTLVGKSDRSSLLFWNDAKGGDFVFGTGIGFGYKELARIKGTTGNLTVTSLQNQYLPPGQFDYVCSDSTGQLIRSGSPCK